LPAGLTTGIGMTSWDGSLGLRAVPLFLKSLKLSKSLKLVIGLCCALLVACTPAAPPDAPNVVLVTLDTVRADYLGLYGHSRETSPELDEFARGAFVFEQAIAQSAVTPVSHASILTGLRPYQHGLRSLHGGANFALPDEQQTLAEMLAARGYATAAFVSAFTATRYYGLHQGFESWDQAFAGNDGAGRVSEAGIVNTGDAQRTAVETTRRALKWLQARKPGPFFLWLHYFDAHDPDVIAPADVQARFPPATRNRHDLLRAVPLFLKSLKMAVGLCCALLLACTPAAPPDAPNVVLVTLDTVRADYLGLYGHPRDTSPELDAFARGAFVFEQAIAQSAVTPVSHASILTGLRPYQHGLRSLHGGANFALPDEQQTLAEMLAARGYATAAFVSAFTATRYYGLHQGFESWDQAFAGNDGAGRVNEAGIVNTGDAQRTAVETTRRALKWLEARKPGRSSIPNSGSSSPLSMRPA